MIEIPRTVLNAACGLLIVLAPVSQALAADPYPSRPVRIVDPFAPGGSTEVQARAIGAKLSEVWGQPVVIEARPGAGSAVGSQLVARATPDGYTLLFCNSGLTTVPNLLRKPPFDPVKDFAPVILAGTQPQVLIVHPSLPRTLNEFLQHAKANPGKVNYGSSGLGSGAHLAIEYLKSLAGVDMLHVPYKGSAPATTALIAGEVQLAAFTPHSVLPHVKSGRLRALVVAAGKRSSVLPDVPTSAEAGLPGFEAISWGAIVAPAGTPRDIVTKLNRQINAVLETPDLRERFGRIGVEPAGGTPQQLAKVIAADVRKWAKVIADAGIPKE